eukprot:jgi/Tetstr1/462202/TSEL_007265.t1
MGSSPTGSTPLAGSSPGSWGSGAHPALLGTSPPSGGHGVDGKTPSAKKFWSRIMYDVALDSSEFQVGFIETVKTGQRKSGKEAWSERQQEHALELSVEDFQAKYPSQKIPFHTVLYFKQNGVIVWEVPRKACKHSEPDRADSNLEVEMSALSLEVTEVSETAIEEPKPGTSAPCAVPELPAECWNIIVGALGTRELCMLSRTSSWHRDLIAVNNVWDSCHRALFGKPPEDNWDTATVKRVCRRSDLRASRWLEGPETESMFDIAGASCLRVDSSKVISAQGSSLRIWSHATGRRISKLQGHSADVTCVAADDDWIVSGCAQSTVRIWGMDDLKPVRTVRGHQGPVTDVHLLNGMPLSSSEDGSICIWDPQHSAPVVTLESDTKINAMAVDEMQNRLTSAGWSLDVWDITTAQQVLQLSSLLGDDPSDGILFEMIEGYESCGMSPYTALSQWQSSVAAGNAGMISLWDLRSAARTFHLQLADAQQVTGLQMDDWKLLSAVSGSPTVHMYDIRALSSGLRSAPWPKPVKTFGAGSEVQCFQFHGETLVVGAAKGMHVWTLGGSASRSQSEAATDGGEPAGRVHKEKKKKIPKRNSRYPKRTTR